MTDEGDTRKIGCGKFTGMSGYLETHCGDAMGPLCHDCQQLRNSDPNSRICDGCKREIPDGWHAMRVAFWFDTHVPIEPKVKVADVVHSALVHSPQCAMRFWKRNEYTQDVYGR